jgi:hypothetical protein
MQAGSGSQEFSPMAHQGVVLHAVDYGNLGHHLGAVIDGSTHRPTCSVVRNAQGGTWTPINGPDDHRITCAHCKVSLQRA